MAVPTRTFRAWSVLRTEIRSLIRETTSSYWTDAQLLDAFNREIDFRVMELGNATEGWVEDTFKADIVANQNNYRLPEGAGRVLRIVRRTTLSGGEQLEPLVRSENWGTTIVSPTSTFGNIEPAPTYRMEGRYIILEPTPQKAVTGGLLIQCEYAPARLDEDTDTIDKRFPDVMETLLVYGTAVEAFRMEAAQGNTDDKMQSLEYSLSRYEKIWQLWIQDRSRGRVFSQPFTLGD